MEAQRNHVLSTSLLVLLFLCSVMHDASGSSDQEDSLKRGDIEAQILNPPPIDPSMFVPRDVPLSEELAKTGLYRQTHASYMDCPPGVRDGDKLFGTNYIAIMHDPEEKVPEECTRVEASNWVPDCDGALDSGNTCYDGKTQELRLNGDPSRNCVAVQIRIEMALGEVDREHYC
eukprot:scaffold11248_cov60-Cylindrotheca_fusiformis.AAC.6